MKRLLFLGGLAIWFFSCANNAGNETGTGRDATPDTTQNMTTNSGAAGTGGVGAGFGSGGSAGTDTTTNPGAGNGKGTGAAGGSSR